MQALTSSTDEPAATSLTERIRLALEADILSGVLPPGGPIDEKGLATAFEVSRTPVREALLLLSAQGLVEIQPRAGVRVRRPHAAELVALLECLAELEAVCARLGAQRMDAAQRLALQQALQQTTQAAAADDRAAYTRANNQFHELLYRGSGNAVVAEQVQATRKRLSAFRRQVMDQPGRLARASREHEQIVEAVLAGNGEAAAQAMRDHILRKGQAVADLVLVHGA